MKSIHKILLDAEVKPSLQRIKILEFLIKNNIHPTVDNVFNNLKEDMPTLSKTTIYNTLKLFEKHGVIKSVTIDDNEIRYDALMHDHGHFKCYSCGAIYDFKYNREDIKFKGLDKFQIKQTELNIKGICPNCKS